jgi:hypothetical protein
MAVHRSAYRGVIAASLALAIGSASALSQPDAPSSTDTMRVTTDTAQYCDSLADMVAQASRAHPGAEPQARSLAEEGLRMCDEGLIRGGLARLRRALLMLQSEK